LLVHRRAGGGKKKIKTNRRHCASSPKNNVAAMTLLSPRNHSNHHEPQDEEERLETSQQNEYYMFTLKIPKVSWMKRETLAWILVVVLNIWILAFHIIHKETRNALNYTTTNARTSSNASDRIHYEQQQQHSIAVAPPMEMQQQQPIIVSSAIVAGSKEVTKTTVSSVLPSNTNNNLESLFHPTTTKTFLNTNTGQTCVRTFHGAKNKLAIQRGLDALEDGNCWCTPSPDDFCSCTPSLSIDILLASGPSHVWLIEQQGGSPKKMACLGGFVEVGETTEEAVARILKEELYLLLKSPPRLFGVYSDPRRDLEGRGHHSVSVVYVVDISDDQIPAIVPNDESSSPMFDVVRVHVDGLDKLNYFIDHRTIVMDYKKSIVGVATTIPKDYGADFVYDHPVKRAVCYDSNSGYVVNLDV